MTRKPSTPTIALLATPDPEISEHPQRRTFSAAEKLRILTEIDRAKPGEIGAILRREGLYSSNLTRWRRQRETGTLAGPANARAGSPPAAGNPLQADVARLERENTALRERLTRAEAAIELQKKVSELLGITPFQTAPTEKR